MPGLKGRKDGMSNLSRTNSKLKGRQSDPTALHEVVERLGERPADGYRRDLLIEYLHLLNDHYHGLYERHLVALAHAMRRPMVDVFEVASFYHHFEVLKDDAKAPGLTVRVCDGLSCEMAGSRALMSRLPELLGSDIRVVAVPCVGRCEQAPVAVVHQCPIPKATPQAIVVAINSGLQMHPQAQEGGRFVAAEFGDNNPTQAHAALHVAPTYTDFVTYGNQGGYALLRAVSQGSTDAESVLQKMEQSGLRGLGGAGFPAGRKWRIVREQVAPRLMAVNIDEGEPGTFKDRTYLEQDPHRFLEGMLVAALVVGVDTCYIYLRDEYHGCYSLLKSELGKLRANPPCPLPQIELRRGAGAYVCGEESAMIESIEGKRGEPRMRPPYIAQVGLFGRPTLEHNFETLYWVRDIVEKGADWFTGFGRHGRTGLRSFSVSGRVKLPGVKRAPAGISVQELIDEYCGGMANGHTLYAYLPGGASGGILPASLAHLPMDFDTLQPYGAFIGSAAVVVLSQADKARDAALNAMRFFAHESCGQCTPCRVGTDKAAKLMEALLWDADTLLDLSTVMVDASICGLGQTAPNPVLCVLKYFPHEVDGSAPP